MSHVMPYIKKEIVKSFPVTEEVAEEIGVIAGVFYPPSEGWSNISANTLRSILNTAYRHYKREGAYRPCR